MDNDRQARVLRQRQAKQTALREAEIDRALALILSQPNGRRFIFWLLDAAGTNLNSFTGNALHTAYNCGRQSIGQALQARALDTAPDFFMTMLQEMKHERDTDAAAFTSAGDTSDADGDATGSDE